MICLHRAVFDRLAVAEHHDVVGDLRHDGEVVGDVERRRAGLVDGALDRGEHVDLRGHVERRRRLVEDDQVGLRAERHRRHRALQLAARNLVRVAAAESVGRGQAEHAEQLAARAVARRARLIRPCRTAASTTWSPILRAGLKAAAADCAT